MRKSTDGILAQVYADRNKVAGIRVDPLEKRKIYERYLRAFEKGVYNYVKEERDPQTLELIPRKYFSGGFDLASLNIDRSNAVPAHRGNLALLTSGVRPSRRGDFSMFSDLIDHRIKEREDFKKRHPDVPMPSLVFKYTYESEKDVYIDILEGKKIKYHIVDNENKLNEFKNVLMETNAPVIYIVPSQMPLTQQQSEKFLKLIGWEERMDIKYKPFEDMRQVADALSSYLSLEGMDFLTGLPLRERFLDECEGFMKLMFRKNDPRVRVGMAMLDFDMFKPINEIWGHFVGDAVLKAFVDEIKKHIREDDIIGRWGGDEFAFFIPLEGEKEFLEEKLKKIGSGIMANVYAANDNKENIFIGDSVLASLKKVCASPDEGKKRLVYEAFMFQLAMQNPGMNLKTGVPGDLKEAIKAVEEKRYIFDRWAITASIGGVAFDETFALDFPEYQKRVGLDTSVKSINDYISGFMVRLMKRADSLAAQAKEQGRNQVITGTASLADEKKYIPFGKVDTAENQDGGIDFNADKVNWQIQHQGGEISLAVDPAMVRRLENAPGFVPVIINVRPLNDLPAFLNQ